MKVKKLIFLVLSIVFSQHSFGQTFDSVEDIEHYFAKNISILNPIEGTYDVQAHIVTSSPFMRDIDENFTIYIVKNKSTGAFDVLFDVNAKRKYSANGDLHIESIGETNVYRLYFENSSNRAYLENGLRLSTTISLSQADARKCVANSRFRYSVTLSYDMIKTYPKRSMYH